MKALQRIFDSFIGALPNLLVAVLVVALTILISNLTRRFVRRVTDRYGRSPNLGIVLGRISQWTVISSDSCWLRSSSSPTSPRQS